MEEEEGEEGEEREDIAEGDYKKLGHENMEGSGYNRSRKQRNAFQSSE